MSSLPRLMLSMSAVFVLAGCPKKPSGPPPVIEGWHKGEGDGFECWHPPQFDKLDEVQRKLKRAETLDAMMLQWKGEKDAGVSFEAGMIDELETTLFGDMADVESVAVKNLDYCKKMAAGGAIDGWNTWLNGLSGQLTEGECFNHFDYTMYDYLEIDTGWQRSMPICQDNKVRVSGTATDKFRIADKGSWITVAGDLDDPTSGSAELPCNFEGCFRGMLIMKFTTEAGVETVYPVGQEMVFTAPEHGTLSYRINDDTFYDNTWYQSGGIIHHASVEITPAR